MISQRWVAFALGAALLGATAGQAAELPSQRSQTQKQKQPEPAKTCNIAGNPGILAGNGVCVRLSGYVSGQVSAGTLR
jgi:hypothetical protein